jgi:uncharacterized membrane protein YkvA (DUF1232 family)
LVLTLFGFNLEALLEAPLSRGRHIPVSNAAAESKFVEVVRDWLVSLPHDLKIAFDAMDDENLPRSVREVAAGVIAYIVSPNDFIGDRNDAVVSYADDAVLLRLALTKALGKGEDEQAFRDRFPELFDGLDENLSLCKSVMGELMTWLENKVPTLPTMDYKGKKITKYLDDGEARELLFDDGLVFRTDYPVDEKTIGDKLKKATTITEVMKRKQAEESRTKGPSAKARA